MIIIILMLYCKNHFHVELYCEGSVFLSIIIILILYCKNHYHDELYCEGSVHPAGTAAVQEEEELRPKSSQSTGRLRERLRERVMLLGENLR